MSTLDFYRRANGQVDGLDVGIVRTVFVREDEFQRRGAIRFGRYDEHQRGDFTFLEGQTAFAQGEGDLFRGVVPVDGQYLVSFAVVGEGTFSGEVVLGGNQFDGVEQAAFVQFVVFGQLKVDQPGDGMEV